MRSLKKSIYVIGLLLQVLCFQTACTNLSESPREVTNINNCWKYAQGDYTGAEQVGYDDGNSPFLQHSLLYGERFLCGLRLVPETSATE